MPTQMEWQDKWNKQETPWSYPEANDQLYADYQRLKDEHGLSADARCFVPLCGDSPAVAFFHEQGHQVDGLEYVAEAIEELKRAHFPGVSFEKKDRVFSAKGLELYCWDIFEFNKEAHYGFIYDRAALVALERDQRPEYAQILSRALEARWAFVFK